MGETLPSMLHQKNFSLLDPYRPYVSDWDAFLEACQRPLPICIWANPVKSSPKELESWIQMKGYSYEAIPWASGAFRMGSDFTNPGASLEYRLGHYHIQEEVSLLAACLLDAQPGERVLDLCAAPGGKSAQIALSLQGRLKSGLKSGDQGSKEGTLVANDLNSFRLGVLRGLIERLGLSNLVLTCQDASRYPRKAGLFDRVLADVPCTCEGTLRKNFDALQSSSSEYIRDLQNRQKMILKKALELCRPGGRVVYSTCTFSPEENEVILQEVLEETEGQVFEILPVSIRGIQFSKGFREWKGKVFDPSIENALRIWPHQNDTGGFFIAVLSRKKETSQKFFKPAFLELESFPESLKENSNFSIDESSNPLFGYLEWRFGILKHHFKDYELVRVNNRLVNLVPHSLELPLLPQIETLGFPFLRTNRVIPKWTTEAAIRFGSLAQKNFIHLNHKNLSHYFKREEFTPTKEELSEVDSPGHILLRFEGKTIGLGRVKKSNADPLQWVVETWCPREWNIQNQLE
jgi:16S rRNA C967 or C1407 C5-methylase (RsmB/RsmF family)/NOL1/NOP2/fmu family ribosome biogenesis protein